MNYSILLRWPRSIQPTISRRPPDVSPDRDRLESRQSTRSFSPLAQIAMPRGMSLKIERTSKVKDDVASQLPVTLHRSPEHQPSNAYARTHQHRRWQLLAVNENLIWADQDGKWIVFDKRLETARDHRPVIDDRHQ